jgi:hypothetical protein
VIWLGVKNDGNTADKWQIFQKVAPYLADFVKFVDEATS